MNSNKEVNEIVEKIPGDLQEIPISETQEQIEKAEELLVKNVEGHPTGPDEIVLNRKDGKNVNVEIRSYPIKIKNQNLILGIACDITERKKWMDELEKSFSMTMATLESTDDGILVTDNNGKIKIFNRRFVDIWKIPEQILVKRDYNEIRKFFIEVVGPLLGLVLCVPLLWKNWENAMFALKTGQRTITINPIPTFPMHIAIPIFTGLLCLVLIAQILRYFFSSRGE